MKVADIRCSDRVMKVSWIKIVNYAGILISRNVLLNSLEVDSLHLNSCTTIVAVFP